MLYRVDRGNHNKTDAIAIFTYLKVANNALSNFWYSKLCDKKTCHKTSGQVGTDLYNGISQALCIKADDSMGFTPKTPFIPKELLRN